MATKAAPPPTKTELDASLCRFDAETTEITLADPAKPGEKPRLRIVANSGKPFSHWYFGKMALDLEGMKLNKSRLPVLLDHRTDQIVGFTSSISKDMKSGGLIAEAVLVEGTDAAGKVRLLAEQGYPWQASVYVPVSKIEELGEGASSQVNGYTFTGPGVIFRESTLREVTVTALGADEQTSAERFGDRKDLIMADKVKTSAAEPETAAADPKGAVHAAVSAERQRIAAFSEVATSPKQREMLPKLISEGVPLADGLLQLDRARREEAAAAPARTQGGDRERLDQITASAPPPSGVDPAPAQFAERTGTLPVRAAAGARVGENDEARRERLRSERTEQFQGNIQLQNIFDTPAAFIDHCELADMGVVKLCAAAKVGA